MPLVVIAQALTQRSVRSLLHLHVQRGVNLQAALVDGVLSVGLLQVLSELFNEIRGKFVTTFALGQLDRCLLCLLSFIGRDLAFGDHTIERVVSSALGPRRTEYW